MYTGHALLVEPALEFVRLQRMKSVQTTGNVGRLVEPPRDYRRHARVFTSRVGVGVGVRARVSVCGGGGGRRRLEFIDRCKRSQSPLYP